ncbi:acriflavin resistance protein [Desulfarculus baarsii DSM 2075]|uniref:Acriflavin resistance protein n=1 Tax=Desulfarculus baarsii (strain ATCC 33931 / DSM 2075 / LMG 7858 / VKM B-1802 / 2st14) TaxID=644282 RepID=E1QJ04_DESB2|nr:efflux RND transporter permease subunit [Desulfarculus baarsii]ADK85547.1 acriflavin resistance protein [Desulfarculus baarsii DSM 2075]
MNKAIAWFAENHVAANLMMWFVIVAGLVTAFNIKLEIFPEQSLDIVTVTVEYPGASPAEVEEGVVRRIEEKIAGVEGVKRIDSSAREGMATIKIEVMQGWEVQKLLDDIKSEVDRITTLPNEAEKPTISEVTQRTEVIWVAVHGHAPEASIKKLAEEIKDDLTNLPGITQAEFMGVRTGRIYIEVPEEALRRYGLTLSKVSQLVAEHALDLPAGAIKTKAGEVLVRAKGRKYTAAEYHDVPILTNPDGSKLTLGQIAQIKEGFQDDVESEFRFQGEHAAMVRVYRVAEQNALDVANTVKDYVAQKQSALPAGIGVDTLSDRSKILKDRLELLTRNMLMGLVLVAVLLGMFLQLRLAFWVTLGIPVSFLAAIWALPYFDVSINMISLFAFILVLGIVVDDAIVVGEHVFTLRERGLPPLQAAVEGATAIGRPVVFSVLTTVAAFWPLVQASGSLGKVMRNIPIVVILVLMASLVESLFVLPSHLAHAKLKTGPEAKEKRSARFLRWVIDGPYKKTLTIGLRWRYAVVAAGVGLLLLALGTVAGGWIKFTLFPKVESDFLQVAVIMPTGTPAAETVAVVARLEEAVRQTLAEFDAKRPEGSKPLLKYSMSYIGGQFSTRHGSAISGEAGGHLAQIWVELIGSEERDVGAFEIINRWRQKVGQLPGVESLTFSAEMFSAGTPVELHLSAPDEETLILASEELKAKLATYNGVFDIDDSFLPGKAEMQLGLKPSAKPLGLTLSELARQVRAAFYGAESLRLQRDQDEVRVMVRYPDNERRSLINIESMRIRLSDGTEVPFSQVAEVTMKQGYTTIERAQRRRVIKVFADVDEKTANASELRRWLEKDVLPQLQVQFPGLRYTTEGEGREEQESIADLQRSMIIALFVIYALLAIPFRSFSQPIIVMAAIPFGLVGAIGGHLLMGLDLSMLSLFGMVGLTGVVVNDSLVLIDAANGLRAQGKSALEAISEAGPLRFRAIILTSLTTFFGLAPMIAERSMQAQFLVPMAVSLGFGVMFATFITLLLIPCGYMILEDAQNGLARLKQRLGLSQAADQH